MDVYLGVLMTRCPVTGREIDTGIVIDRRTFERLASFISLVRCPICSLDHEWSKKDAWVCESLVYENLEKELSRITNKP